MQAFFANTQEMIHFHPILAFIAVYLAGILVSFTPCVYPVIPLTLGVIGARSSGSRFRGFTISLIFVLGMAISYAVLGLIASMSGQLFGQISSNPWTYFVVGNAYLFFGLSMVSEYIFPQIQIFPSKLQKKKEGVLGVFIMGALAGLIVGPCTAPVLASILVYVGSKKNLFYGFSLLFVFGYGVGFLFILLGTFTGLIASMPKSGIWLERIKKIFGFLLILAAEYLFIKMGGLLV
ncbi:MAG: sulfite exporter TauE/SafE family protein [Candidatus Omnitrophica bacterium]|nr:sulfite exporter TauE/SafE family protein [Candidatus Omnitrophota bacterium]